MDLWAERTRFHSQNPDIAFVAPFENSGEAVGVTMPHPHGQIYAMPFIPPTVEKELSAALEFSAKDKDGCLFCELLEGRTEGARTNSRGKRFFRRFRSLCRALSC